MIEIFPSKLAGGPVERYYTERPMTFGSWLAANVRGFEPRPNPPISILLNGKRIEPGLWLKTEFHPDDSVAVFIEPKGDALSTIFKPGPLAKLFGLGNPFDPVKPVTPNTNSQSRSGRDLSLSTVKGNQVSLNAMIPEIAGQPKRYPDLLLPYHRYFGEPREQWTEMLICVGKGKFQILPGDILVGDTPIASLGSTASYAIYGPGEDVSSESASKWWHSSTEVGSTNTGGAGLTLTTTTDIDQQAAAEAFLFSGYQVSAPEGAGWFPVGWGAGLIARLVAPYPVTFTEPSGGGATVISSDYLAMVRPFVGMLIEIAGDNAGDYVVASYTPPVVAGPGVPASQAKMTLKYDGGAPVTGLQTGNLSSSIGYRGLRYRIVGVADDAEEDNDETEVDEAHGPSSITVVRLTDSGAEDGDWGGFDYRLSNSGSVTLDGSTTEGEWAGPFPAVPEGEVTRRIELDFFFPQGLIRYTEKNGNIRQVSVKVEIQYRDISAAGEWASVGATYTAQSPDQQGYLRSIGLPEAMRPEVRVRRIGEESTSTNKIDRVQWYGLRGRIDRAPTRYEGATVIALYIKGSNRLAAQAESLVSVRATRILPVYHSGAWVEQPTRSIAPWVAHVAKSIGYTDDDIDLAELERLGSIWDARGDYFDLAITEQSTVVEELNKALMAGFAELTIDRGQIRPVRDEPRTVFEHMYTPQNMLGNLTRKFTTMKPDDYDGVEVEYVDGDTWQKETVICKFDSDAGVRLEKLKVEGVINRDRAWRIGMRQRRKRRYQRFSYSWRTELSGLNSRYLSYCAASDDIPGYGQSSILIGFAKGNGMVLLESSEPLAWTGSGEHVVGLRRPDGTLSGPWPATRVDDTRLTIQELDFEPNLSWETQPPHMLFGTLERWCYPVLISSIDPGDYSADLDAVNYDVRVYADDDNFAPN